MASFDKIKAAKEALDKYGGRKGKASSLGGGGGASMLGDGPQKVKGKVDQAGGAVIGVSGESSSSKNPEGLKKPTEEVKKPGAGKNAEQPGKKKGDAAKTNWKDLVNTLGKGVGEGGQRAKGKIDQIGMAVIGVSADSVSKKPEWLKKAKEIKTPGKIENGKAEQAGLNVGEIKDSKGGGRTSTLGETKQKINRITKKIDAVKPEEGSKNRITTFPNQLGETSKNFSKVIDGPKQHDKPVSASQNGLEKAAQEKPDDGKSQNLEDVKPQTSLEVQEVQPESNDQSKKKDIPQVSEEMTKVAIEEAEVADQKEVGEIVAGDENGEGVSTDNTDISPERGEVISEQSARDVRVEKEQQEEQQVKELEAEAELGLPPDNGPLADVTNREAVADEGSNIDGELFDQPTHSGAEFDAELQNRLANWNEQQQNQIEEREVYFQHQQATFKAQGEHERFDEQAREMRRLAAEAISRAVQKSQRTASHLAQSLLRDSG